MPAHLTAPPRVDSSGPEAVALAASAGLFLDPWQAQVLDVALGERPDGKWAAREVGLVVPRQNGKGSILEALLVASLLLFEERLILYSAHEFKTAQETFLRVKHLVESTDDLASRVLKIHNAHGSEGIEFRDGQRLRFVARTKGSGRGFSPQRVILDEALNLSARSVSALLFAMSAQSNPQLWYTSSAPEDTPEGAFLRSVMRRGREGGDSLAYLEYCAADDSDPTSDEAVAAANPGFPHRINPETVATERAATDPEDFKRERLGIIDLDSAVFRVVNAGQWAACADRKHRPSATLRYALDVSPDARSCAVAVSDGTHHEIVKYLPGVDWVVNLCLEHRDDLKDGIVLDPAGPAVELVAPLEAAGITVQTLSTADAKAACGRFLTAIGEGTLRHIGQPELDLAVSNADRREVGDGGWLWSRVRSSVDICPLVAATWAGWAAGATKPAVESQFLSLADYLDEE